VRVFAVTRRVFAVTRLLTVMKPGGIELRTELFTSTEENKDQNNLFKISTQMERDRVIFEENFSIGGEW